MQAGMIFVIQCIIVLTCSVPLIFFLWAQLIVCTVYDVQSLKSCHLSSDCFEFNFRFNRRN